MANEYLQRTPTSTGNRRVFTWSGWVKISAISSTSLTSFGAFRTGTSQGTDLFFRVGTGGAVRFSSYNGSSYDADILDNAYKRDGSSWIHLLAFSNTTSSSSNERWGFYINGVRANSFDPTSSTFPSINYQAHINNIVQHYIGSTTGGEKGYLTDIFFIDGQALTPDVFGFNKPGKGYISAGSTQATDFRNGQWVPRKPGSIIQEINDGGGFGVNGFYLPMNDSKNFGADFHCDPNSIITLNEKLPQPRVGVATTASASAGFTDALRADPYAANLVLALPFVSSGLCTNGTNSGINTGFGDYSHIIRGSGSAKVGVITALSNVSIANTSSYYGSAAYFDGAGDWIDFGDDTNFEFGSGDFTIEFWRKRLSTSSTEAYVAKYVTGPSATNSEFWFGTLSSGRESFYWYSGSTSYNIDSPSNIATIGQLDHIAAVRKSNVITLYVNGTAVGINTNVTYSLNASSSPLYVGGNSQGTATNNYPFNGYLQDLRIYKGVAKYTGGFDVSKPYTPVGIATFRAVPDTCLNNFCTWNPLYPVLVGSNSTYVNGNLTISESTSNASQVSATIGVSTGKWYYEALPTTVSGDSHLIGIRPAEWFTYNSQNRTAYRSNGDVYNDAGGTAQSGTSYSSNDIIGIAFDMNNRRLWFSKNGSWVYSGDPNNNSNPAVSFASTYTNYTPAAMFNNVAGTQVWNANFGQNPTFSGNTTAGTFTDSNGKGLFKYEPPSGFLALCEDNLPTPAISDPGKYFKAILYQGDNTVSKEIKGVGFQPDLIWFKNRTDTVNWNIFDNVRGPAYQLSSNTTGAEVLRSGGGCWFNEDGFTVSTNANNNNPNPYVAYCWRAGGGSTQTNTNGSITSVVSVNQDAGFSIVSYTGSSTNSTVGHGLGRVPKFILVKKRNISGNWVVYHSGLTGQKYLEGLNNTNATGINNPSPWNNTDPTSSVITLLGAEANVSGSGNTFIAYCWAEIEGFSKFGSYVGNGNADGPFVYCGFKPAWVMIKRTDSGNDWVIFDSSRTSTNPANAYLEPNTSDIETTDSGAGSRQLDILSNGFKLRDTAGAINASGGTYIFAAYAESPFQTANAK